MKDLVGLSREALLAEVTAFGEKPFRVKQLWQWIYNKGVTDFTQMTNIAKPLQAQLAEHYFISRPETVTEKNSADGTRKWLFRFGEIVGQFMAARDSYGEWPSPTDETRFLSNVVVMGMGEPLMNYDNLVTAMRILMDGEGIALSKRRITVSTSGIADRIPDLATDLGVKLAVSLHAPTDEIRSQIMPINRRYPLKELMAACKAYQQRLEHRQYITMEYVMLKGINDSVEQAHQLIELVKGLEVKFNLIPFNPWEGCPYESSSNNAIRRFQKVLEDAWFPAPIRVSRGQDIMAACGQLKSVFHQSQTK